MMQYLEWRGDLSFSQAPFNEVDNLIFSQLAFIDYTGLIPPGKSVTLSDVAGAYFRKHLGETISMGMIVPDAIVGLFRKAALSERFGEVLLREYVNRVDPQTNLQFSAVTATLPDGSEVIAFRGTDDTIVGWKEDFNLAFRTPVPSQLEAVAYLCRIAESSTKPLRLVGHSKGGNLAIYAAVHSAPSVRNRLLDVYNNDGPGFGDDTLLCDGFQELREKIHTIVPQASLVGMLLDHDQQYRTVKSRQVGIFQHDGFSWEVLGGRFQSSEQSQETKRRNRTIHFWIRSMSPEEQEAFTEAFFRLLQTTEATTLTELFRDRRALLKGLRAMTPEDKKMLAETVRRFREERKKSRNAVLP